MAQIIRICDETSMLDTLNYQIHGPDIADAPVLVLLHGLFGSADNLSVIRRDFESTHKVISMDLPDHGESPRSEGFSFERWAQKVALTLTNLDIDKASIVAHSLGGKVAMYLSYINPILIDKLIILDIAPVAYSPRHQNVINGLTAVDLLHLSNRTEAKSSLAKFVKDPGTQGFLLKSLYQDEQRNWKWRFNLEQLINDYDKLSQWPLSDKVVFKHPVLFIKGKNSDYINSEHQATILQQFPAAIAKIVDAGHWLHAEKPQVINRLITNHLRG